jgi:hypothetical protein
MKYLSGLMILLGLTVFSGCGPNKRGPEGELFLLTDPANAAVEVNGEFIGATPLSARVPAGQLLVAVRREGFHTERFSLALPPGGRMAREFQLRPVHGLILLESDPPGATVTLGGVDQGETPVVLHAIRLGDHRARLSLAGFNDREVTFSVEDRIPKRVSAAMDSNSGTVLIHSNPPGAAVQIDGRSEGITPLTLTRVPRGERDLVLRLEGHQPHQTRVLVNPGDSTRVEAELVPLPGAIEVVSLPAAARVYINDEYRGDSPLRIGGLTPGPFVIRVERRGHADAAKTVRVGRGETLVEEFRLERNSGTLEIITRPANVRVIVNGEYAGTTRPRDTDVISEPLQVELLTQGAHSLQLVREGYIFENKRFMIARDQVTTLDETLRRIFIPNTILRIGDGQDQAITGRLHRRHPNGDVEMEVREGVYRTFPAAEIRSLEPLRQVEEL